MAFDDLFLQYYFTIYHVRKINFSMGTDIALGLFCWQALHLDDIGWENKAIDDEHFLYWWYARRHYEDSGRFTSNSYRS